MNEYRERQQARNRESLGGWERFSQHRAAVTRKIECLADGSQPSLCLLGAGNTNDVDLRLLSQVYAQIELVDLDEEALVAGLKRQSAADTCVITTRQVDVTGGLADLGPASSDRLTEVLTLNPVWTEQRFSVVSSLCLLSQLIESVAMVLGPDSPDLPSAIVSARRQHLRVMASLLLPQGTGILVTDFVSSETSPEMYGLSGAALAQAARGWIENRNFFTGTNPFAIRHQIQYEMSGEVKSDSVVIDRPWLWDLGPRAYAVSAIRFQRTEE